MRSIAQVDGEMWGALPDDAPLRLEFIVRPRRPLTPDKGVPPPPRALDVWNFGRQNRVWKPRKRGADSRDYYDNDKCMSQAFDYDWSILVRRRALFFSFILCLSLVRFFLFILYISLARLFFSYDRRVRSVASSSLFS